MIEKNMDYESESIPTDDRDCGLCGTAHSKKMAHHHNHKSHFLWFSIVSPPLSNFISRKKYKYTQDGRRIYKKDMH